MTNGNIEPTDPSEDNDSNPIDDSGINNDHILDLCDFIINRLWEKYISESKDVNFSVRELKDIAYTIQSVWGLCQDIIELDKNLRMFGDQGPPTGGDFGDPEEEY